MIHEIERTCLVVSDEPLPFELKNKAHIDVFWEQAFEANPRLWNGIFYMFSETEIRDGVLHGTAHRTDFATFLFWRDHGYDPSTTHVTGNTFPILTDQSLLAVRMSAHTANAGRIYFPAGSFDSADIVDGALDPVVNFSREMEEEIGITVETAWLSGPLLVAWVGQAIHVTRRMNVPMNFDQVEKHWRKHQAAGGDDEVDCLVHIKSKVQIPQKMMTYAQELCVHHFDGLQQ